MKKIILFLCLPSIISFSFLVFFILILSGATDIGVPEPHLETPTVNGIGFPYVEGMPVTLTQGFWTTPEEARQWWGSVTPPYASGMHQAVDYSSGESTEIIAILAGTVVSVGNGGGYGNHVIIQSVLDDGMTLYVLYAHFSAVTTHVGALVTIGSVVGKEGSTGVSTGSHLHLEISKEYASDSLAGERLDYQKLRV